MLQVQTLTSWIVTTLRAKANCERVDNAAWLERHTDLLQWIERNRLPSGSGINCGTRIDWAKSTDARLVLTCSFHHMDENGMYDGWTNHSVIVVPTFSGIDVRVTGRNRNQIKEYLADTFFEALTQRYILGADNTLSTPCAKCGHENDTIGDYCTPCVTERS